MLGLSHEISPNRETTTTFGSSGGFGSGGDLSESDFDFPQIRASDFDIRSVASAGPRSRRKKKIPEPSAPDETLLFGGEKTASKQPSPRSPRSLRTSESDSALHNIEKRKSASWGQSTMADIRHIDSSMSTIDSETDQNDSTETKTSVTVIIEHFNDNDDLDLNDGQLLSESETATDNKNNNIEDADTTTKLMESDSDKESEIDQMDTKVTDSESENDKEDMAIGGKDDNEESEQTECVVIKKRRKNEDGEENNEAVVVIEKGEDDVNKSMSDIISENLSDYNELKDFSGDEAPESTDNNAECPSRLREHREVKMQLVLEGYYKFGEESSTHEAEGSVSEHSDNVHDSGINTPDLTNELDPLSPMERDFFFNKEGEFDDTFSEIFYDAENDFETSSRGGLPNTDESPHQLPQAGTIGCQTTFKMILPQEDETAETGQITDDIVNEIKVSIEHDRRLVATILDQKQYKEIIEVDIPYDLRFPHEKQVETMTTTLRPNDNNSNRLSICNDCSLTRRKKTPRSSPKRRSKDCSDIGLPVCAECKCTIAHYSYQSKTKPIDHIDYSLSNYCDVVFCDSALKAMEFTIDTLDKEGPGFIFVMTEALGDKQLPWSTEQRYKIASSRQPDRWILEFKSRNIEVDVVWQIRVQNHIKAVREVHSSLQQYNLHTNWFRCSLAIIIENVLNIASKYRVSKNSKHSTYS